jgi:hypothetical protein
VGEVRAGEMEAPIPKLVVFIVPIDPAIDSVD